MAVSIRLRATGFDLPALTLSTQLQRYATHRAACGWWPSDQRSEPPEVLSYGGQNKFVLGASRPAQSKPTKPQDALQMGEPHLDLFALTP